MIYFLTTRQNEFPIRLYLQGHGAAVARQIQPIRYEQLLTQPEPPSGTYIFADVELLTDHQREAAARIWENLAARGCRLLNHPARSLRRYDLLRLLHARGVNRFNVYRVAAGEQPRRFPVFVRGENDHRGSRTPLLHSPAELAAAMRRLWWTRWLHRKLGDTIITEFCDTADEAGVYRKYSAFHVGGRILSRHVFFSDRWMIKSWQLMNDRFRQEEEAYIAANPHERELLQIFAAANIDYGRIDYALHGGQIQVWEINTNPMIVASGRGGNGARSAVHDSFATRIHHALRNLDCSAQPIEA